MKSSIALNLVWAGVAAGAFYGGMQMRSSEGAAGAGGVRNKVVSAQPATGPGGVSTVKDASKLASSDPSVIDFFKKYGLDTGVPLTPDVMKEAIAEAVRENNPVKSQMMFARLMEALTPENAPAALAMLRENVGGWESMRYMPMLAHAWGSVDPESAMKTLGADGDRGSRFAQPAVLTAWASKDPQAAMKWLETFEGGGKEFMSMAIVNGMAKSDVEGAMKYASGLKDEGERARAAETIAREMIRTGGTEKATAWLGNITDPTMKRGAFETMADQMLRSDPAKAAEFVKSHQGEEYAKNAVGNIAQSLSRTDVKQGLEFASNLKGEAQAKAYGEVVGEWMRKDNGANAEEASKYVNGLTAGPNKDAGAQQVARNIARENPQDAIVWAGAIQNPELRASTLVDVGRDYMRSSPQEAAAWLATSGLTAEQQQQVTAPPDRGNWRGFGAGTGFGGATGGGGPPAGGGGRGGRGR